MLYNFLKSKLFGSICYSFDSEISSVNLLEKSSMASSVSMSVYDIIKIMPCVEGDRSDCQSAMVVVEG